MSATTPARESVIRLVKGAAETPAQRLLRKHVPAWVVSGATHVLLVAVLLTASVLFARPPAPPPSDDQLVVVPDDRDRDDKEANLTEEVIGLDPDIPPAVEADRLDQVNVETTVQAPDPGIETATQTTPVDVSPPPSVVSPDAGTGAPGDLGAALSGIGGTGGHGFANDGFNGRGAATRSKLVALHGGNDKSEAAVARGLAWLAKQQKANGAWEYDKANHGAAATGMALLPFLAAGHTHKVSRDNKYNKNVDAGLKHLIRLQKPDGSLPGGMYAHAIATIALCEALGMTGDKALLQYPAQKAVNYLIAAQADNGGWRYGPKQPGDLSVSGWVIQALQSAKLCKELTVDKKSLQEASKFLDSLSSGSAKAQYGYTTAGRGSLSMTAVGLLSRYYLDGWGPNHPGMATGVGLLLKGHPPGNGALDLYYYYYATQVVHFYEGAEWHKEWNPAMRDRLIGLQVPQDKGPLAGSWDPTGDRNGAVWGRVGTTCMTLLTLEVYYRHLPLYKREGAGGARELDRVK